MRAKFTVCLGCLTAVFLTIGVFSDGMKAVAQSSTASPIGASPNTTPIEDSDAAFSGFDHYVVRGGWVTHFLLIPLSIVALALYVEYAATIRRTKITPPETRRRLQELLQQRQYAEAVQFAQNDRSVLAHVVLSGLLQASNGFAAMEHAMEDAMEERAAKLARKIEYLNLIGAVAPMLGLLGTVHGIIGMFISISDAGGIPVMSRISYDLGSALVATFWGLMVAIPALAIFAILRNRIDVLLGECATASERLMAGFKPVALGASSPAAPHASQPGRPLAPAFAE